MTDSARYRLVQLRNGTSSVHSLARYETFHPGIGPEAEADALYVRQLRLPERVRETWEEFVVWDVGLGAAANALTVMRRIDEVLGSKTDSPPARAKRMRIFSFDETTEALRFALQHVAELPYLDGFENIARELIQAGRAEFTGTRISVRWQFECGDFPALLESPDAAHWPTPHAILFDPHSPKRNPGMWTVKLFADLYRLLDPQRPCSLATFTRSTMARAAILLGGFCAGIGHPTGFKEETTVAANRPELLKEPLDASWLETAKRSDSAEPLWQPVYRQSRLAPETLHALLQHPQFRAPGVLDGGSSNHCQF